MRHFSDKQQMHQQCVEKGVDIAPVGIALKNADDSCPR